MKAYNRLESKEDQEFFPDPHPYEATLLSAAALLVSEYEGDIANVVKCHHSQEATRHDTPL